MSVILEKKYLSQIIAFMCFCCRYVWKVFVVWLKYKSKLISEKHRGKKIFVNTKRFIQVLHSSTSTKKKYQSSKTFVGNKLSWKVVNGEKSIFSLDRIFRVNAKRDPFLRSKLQKTENRKKKEERKKQRFIRPSSFFHLEWGLKRNKITVLGS